MPIRFTHLSYKCLALFFIGMANSIALPLFGSTLSLYLREEGFSKQAIGLMTLTHLPLLVKLLWSYPIDHVSLPYFKQTPRKGWLLLALLGMSLSCLFLSLLSPAAELWLFACSLVALALFTSILYVVGLNYELELLEENEYATGSFFVTLGYRMGLLFSGAGVLGSAHIWGWSCAFQLLAALLILALGTIFLLPEPSQSQDVLAKKRSERGEGRVSIILFWRETLKKPILRLIRHEQFPLLIGVLCICKTGDHLTHAMNGPFFLSLGFDKKALSLLVKLWGVILTISGGFVGAALLRYAYSVRTVVYTAAMHTLSLLGYLYLSVTPKSYYSLALCVMAEHFTAGLAMTGLIVFLWRTVEKAYAPVQYAFCWAMLSGKGTLLTVLGGLLASKLSWPSFYLLSFGMGITPFILFLLVRRQAEAQRQQL